MSLCVMKLVYTYTHCCGMRGVLISSKAFMRSSTSRSTNSCIWLSGTRRLLHSGSAVLVARGRGSWSLRLIAADCTPCTGAGRGVVRPVPPPAPVHFEAAAP